ncbi:MAG: Wzz/FepE/Etk N-terminal domain-containing protein [Gallionella sp.]
METNQTPMQPVKKPINQDEDEIDLIELLLVIVKHNRFILKFTGAAAIFSVIYALMQPNIYTANTVVMPPQHTASAASALLGKLGGLAGMAGGALGIKSANAVYIGMLKSRTVADALIVRLKLMALFKSKNRAAARATLQGASSIKSSKAGFITIAYSDKDPKLAAVIANAYVDELVRFNQTLAVTDAAKRRLFFEKQLDIARQGLDSAELAMKTMQERTGVIQLEGQSRAILAAEAGLRAKIATKEIQLSAMKSFATTQNPDYRRTKQLLVSLRAQLGKLEHANPATDEDFSTKKDIPKIAVEYSHKLRDLKYYGKLFEFMTQQVLVAKIDEAKEAAIIQVVDKAVAPKNKSKPKRSLIVILTTFVAFFIGIIGAFIREGAERARENPDQAERMTLFRRYCKQGS